MEPSEQHGTHRHGARAVATAWAVVLLALTFLAVLVLWSYLRLLVCWEMPRVAYCTESYLAPLVLWGLAELGFLLALAFLSLHAEAHGDPLPRYHPARPRRGLFKLSSRSARNSVRAAHVLAWSSAGVYGAFALWFIAGIPSATATLLGALVVLLALVSVFVWLVERK